MHESISDTILKKKFLSVYVYFACMYVCALCEYLLTRNVRGRNVIH